MSSLVTYHEAVQIIIIKIKESGKSVSEISSESGVSYDVVSLIKNNYKKKYPKSVAKLLKYFGINSTQVIAFDIE